MGLGELQHSAMARQMFSAPNSTVPSSLRMGSFIAGFPAQESAAMLVMSGTGCSSMGTPSSAAKISGIRVNTELRLPMSCITALLPARAAS
jgi:hypothetical protein